jgi:hypothetical protein
MRIGIEGTLYEIGDIDDQPGARIQMEDGSIVTLDGLPAAGVKMLGALLFEKVLVTIEIERVAVSEG